LSETSTENTVGREILVKLISVTLGQRFSNCYVGHLVIYSAALLPFTVSTLAHVMPLVDYAARV